MQAQCVYQTVHQWNVSKFFTNIIRPVLKTLPVGFSVSLLDMGSSMSQGNFQISNILMNRRSNLGYISSLVPFLIYSLEGRPDFHSRGDDSDTIEALWEAVRGSCCYSLNCTNIRGHLQQMTLSMTFSPVCYHKTLHISLLCYFFIIVLLLCLLI